LAERPLRFVDTETLGLLDYHPIIEIAILDGNGRPLLDTLVKPPPAWRVGPGRSLPTFDMELCDPVALEYSGYMDADGIVDPRWRDAPELHEIADPIIEALSGCQVWGHTIQFDIWKLRHWFRLYGVDFPPNLDVPCFNVETLAAEHLPFLEHFSLTAIADALGVPSGRAHTAHGDAVMAWQVHSHLCRAEKLDRWLFQTNHLKRQPTNGATSQ
jgi:DNA polymerase III epsilon subunit-like protein